MPTDAEREREELLGELPASGVGANWAQRAEARRLIAAHDEIVRREAVEEAMEAKAREVEEKLEPEVRVGRTWIAAFLRSFRAPAAQNEEKP